MELPEWQKNFYTTLYTENYELAVASNTEKDVIVDATNLIKQLQAENKEYKDALQWIAQQPCRQDAEGACDDTDCSQTGACLTEWCFPCYAKEILKGE